MIPLGIFKENKLLYKKQVEEQQERDQEQEKNKNKEEIKKDFYLLQRTRVLIFHPMSMPNISIMMFLQLFLATTFQKIFMHSWRMSRYTHIIVQQAHAHLNSYRQIEFGGCCLGSS
jgi:hypothetical protein